MAMTTIRKLRGLIREELSGVHFFHMTPLGNLDSIMKHGLVPAQSSTHEPGTSYPEPRIYLVRGEHRIDDLIDLIELTSANYTHGPWALLKLDPRGVGPTRCDAECGDDPDFVYTVEPVPPGAIEHVETVEF